MACLGSSCLSALDLRFPSLEDEANFLALLAERRLGRSPGPQNVAHSLQCSALAPGRSYDGSAKVAEQTLHQPGVDLGTRSIFFLRFDGAAALRRK